MAPWHNWQLSQSLPIDSIAAQIIIMGAIIDTLEKKQRLKCHHHYCHYGWHESSKSGVAHGVWLVKISDWDDPKNSLTFQWYHTKNSTVFENHRKSLIQYCIYILSGQKLIKNAKNGQFLTSFWKPEACGQSVLPDNTLYCTLVENYPKMSHFILRAERVTFTFLVHKS